MVTGSVGGRRGLGGRSGGLLLGSVWFGEPEVVGVIALFLISTSGHGEKGPLATEQAHSMDRWVTSSAREISNQYPVRLLC